MRILGLAVTVFLALFCTTATAQETNFTGYGPFRFGMSSSDARSTLPDGVWRETPIATNGAEMLGPRILVGEEPMLVRLLFLRDRLARIELVQLTQVAQFQECADSFTQIVVILEQTLGPLFARESAPNEELAISEMTLGGSALRVYQNTASGGYDAELRRASPHVGVVGMRALPLEGDSGWSCIEHAALRAPASFFESDIPAYTPPNAPPADRISAAELIERPVWRSRPSAEDISRAFPPFAAELGISGGVFLTCLVEEAGALWCDVQLEEPTGLGLAQAALTMAAQMRMEERIRGEPTLGKRVTLVFPFRVAP